MAGTHTTGQIEDWAQGSSWLHRREPRAKIIASLSVLVALSLAANAGSALVAIVAWMVVVATATARLPMFAVIVRAATVLPFALTFALVTWLAGDPARAGLLVAKSFLSAWIAVLLMSTTPLSALLHGAERLGVPRLLTEVMLMLVRYLRVLGDRAASMRRAAASRGAASAIAGRWSLLPWGTEAQRLAGAGMVAALFGEAMERATRVHGAMLARGYTGRMPVLTSRPWQVGDSLMVLAAMAGLGAAVWFRS